jgi:signal recognition particle subunit SRP54
VDHELLNELKLLNKFWPADEVLLIVDATAGRNMVKIAEDFNNSLKLTGLIVTKFDGTGQAGSTLSINYLTGLPIKFIGSGERIDELEVFHPDRLATRILGMGDIKTLMEKVNNAGNDIDENDLLSQISNDKFNFNDMLSLIKSMKKMGKLSKILSLIPGIGNKVSNNQLDEIEENLLLTTVLTNSMTNKEKTNPLIVRFPTRKARIIRGAGINETKFNKLLSNFEILKKKFKQISQFNKGGSSFQPNQIDELFQQ